MVELFGIDIAQLIDDNISDGLPDVVLIKVTPGTRDPSDVTGGTQPTSASFAAKGFIEDYTDFEFNSTSVQIGDRKITLIGNSIESLQIPDTGDRITIEGETWNIMNVKRDPAAATYICQGRQ